ncbi:tetratricopeptide repeat protein [Pseudomonas indica]|uniref:Uncharacterized protein n=1 Tax=Pseudomonas indica TaxID=137658 RepID=A0A1G9PJ20_9PSED|nr:hypothetical protein [Pseudomonas indica]SDL98770.1 hypothetical protein SAMN05216186_1392 [Pseudomonas indica]
MKILISLFLYIAIINISTAGELTKKLSPSIFGSEEIVFSYRPVDGDERSLTAALFLKNGQRMNLPVQCDPEGGEPSLSDSYSVKLSDGSEALIITCSYHLDHSGLGIKGVQYTSFVLAETSSSLERKESLEGLISGYEGTTEEGAKDYFFYNTKELATQKLKDGEVDSPALIHRVLLSRLADHDYEAITSYVSDEDIRTTITRTPISKADVTSYNDIGFALAEVGKFDLALHVLRNVENIAPDRTVLMLNLADTLWAKEQQKEAKPYYKKYYIKMKSAGKEKSIPTRVMERLKQ